MTSDLSQLRVRLTIWYVGVFALVMIAFGMNGEQLPPLNDFPLKLIVPGRCWVYWIKMLSDIEVLDLLDDNYWTTTTYRIPDESSANVKPAASMTVLARSSYVLEIIALPASAPLKI